MHVTANLAAGRHLGDDGCELGVALREADRLADEGCRRLQHLLQCQTDRAWYLFLSPRVRSCQGERRGQTNADSSAHADLQVPKHDARLNSTRGNDRWKMRLNDKA